MNLRRLTAALLLLGYTAALSTLVSQFGAWGGFAVIPWLSPFAGH